MKKNYLFLVIIFFSTQAFAQLATWELSGLTGITAGAVTTTNVAVGVSLAELSRGPGINAQSVEGAYSSSGWPSTTNLLITDYYQIKIKLSPTSQPLINFGTLSLFAVTSEPGPNYAAIRSSRDTFKVNIGSSIFMDSGSSGFAEFITFSLTSLNSIPLNAGDSITFRIYGYESNNSQVGAYFNIGDGFPGIGADIIFSAALPVSLTSFTAISDTKVVNLRWTTVSETDNEFFVVERSADGISFEDIGWKKGAGTSNRATHYDLTDSDPLTGKNYYRLRQTDYDGKTSYSPVVIALFNRAGNLTLSPSPASDLMRIQIEKPSEDDGLWQVFDIAGRLVQSGNWQAESAVTSVNVGTLTNGIYTFRLSMGQQVLVKQFRKE